MEERSDCINKIIDIELDMFQKVPTASPTQCQQSPGGFKLVRRSSFNLWSDKTLKLYYEDLKKALEKGKNLLTEKYARMDDLIPPLSENPLIDKIVKIEVVWRVELMAKYPNIFGFGGPDGGCGVGFEKYLRSELETFSDDTIHSYHIDITEAVDEGRNLSEEKAENMFKGMGYASLEKADKIAGSKKQ